MNGFRYGRYDEGPDPLRAPDDLRDAVDALGRSVLGGASPARALHDLLRRGADGRSGLDGLLARVRARVRLLRAQGRLDGTLSRARRLLDRAVAQERAALLVAPDGAARLRERELGELPSDTAAAIRRLASYRWRSPEARGTFERLRGLLRREVLDSRFRGVKRALEDGGREEWRRVAAMLDALYSMLSADDRGEHTAADFDRFMAAFGDFFPEAPRGLAELVDSLARRSAAAQRVLDSLAPEQRAELLALSRHALEEAGLAEAVDRLGAALRARRPDLAWSGGVPVDGERELGMGDATTVVAELADLAELESALEQDYPGAGLDDIDPHALRRALGRRAADDLERLRALDRRLRERGYLSGPRIRPGLTPKAVRRLGETALRDALSDPPGERPGHHRSAVAGAAGESAGSSRRWRFGDEQPLDAVRTLVNAAGRGGGPGGRLRLLPEDFEVVETERSDAAAVCLLVDLSYSMAARDLWEAAKRTALALHTLVSSRFPQDAVQIVGFNDRARELAPAELAELVPERVQGTNLQHALMLAGRHLDRNPDFRPVVLVVTDGEPTAHLGSDGSARFAYPPTRHTTEATLAEVDRMTRRGARMTVFSLADDPRLVAFVSAMTRRNGGRTLRPGSGRLGGSVVRDFLSQRRAR